MTDRTVRPARPDDHDAVSAFTEDTWPERDVGDYIPAVFPEWIAGDGPEQRTVVVEVDGTIAGICQARLLSADEAWLQGMRVHPDHRGAGHGAAMVADLFDWCRERGATVARNMVFGWNTAGLGQSRAVGFEPAVSCRWARPDPEPVDTDLSVGEDTAVAWRFWTDSDARDALRGLALVTGEAWALSDLDRARLDRIADAGRVLTVVDGRARGMAARLGTRETDGETVADYAVGAWADLAAARSLFDAIRADAAGLGADATRVCIPETVRFVSDAAAARVALSDEPVYVFAADLTG
jgi:GNAT superfamily N-acetyltransferase